MTIAIVLIACALFVAYLMLRRPAADTKRAKYRAVDASRKQYRKYPLEVVGESHYQAALENICGGHNEDGHALETTASLVLEDDNAYDNKAVAVHIQQRIVGYLARDNARLFRKLQALDAQLGTGVPAIIMGGWKRSSRDVGSFGVYLALTLERIPKAPRKRRAATS